MTTVFDPVQVPPNWREVLAGADQRGIERWIDGVFNPLGHITHCDGPFRKHTNECYQCVKCGKLSPFNPFNPHHSRMVAELTSDMAAVLHLADLVRNRDRSLQFEIGLYPGDEVVTRILVARYDQGTQRIANRAIPVSDPVFYQLGQRNPVALAVIEALCEVYERSIYDATTTTTR